MTPRSVIEEYRRLGWEQSLVPVPEGSKAPRIKEWSTRQFAPADFMPGCNIGLRLGPTSDVDLDCLEAIALAPIYLPATGAKFGRASKPDSHWLYESPGALFDHWIDPLCEEKGKQTLLELRAPGKDGRAHQTIIPPSVADGERREWSSAEIHPAVVDAGALRQLCIWLAIGCLVRRYISV
jgi:hypothetical protein